MELIKKKTVNKTGGKYLRRAYCQVKYQSFV